MTAAGSSVKAHPHNHKLSSSTGSSVKTPSTPHTQARTTGDNHAQQLCTSSSSYVHSNHFLIKTYVYVKSPPRHIHVRMITTVEPSALTERAQAHTPERLLSRSKRQTKSCSRASFSVNLHLTSVCSCRLQFTGSTQKGVFMHYLFIVKHGK